jgi:hypothetical protein
LYVRKKDCQQKTPKRFGTNRETANLRYVYSFEMCESPQQRRAFQKMNLTRNFAGARNQRIRYRIVSARLRGAHLSWGLRVTVFRFPPPFRDELVLEQVSGTASLKTNCSGQSGWSASKLQSARGGVERLISLFVSQASDGCMSGCVSNCVKSWGDCSSNLKSGGCDESRDENSEIP